MIDLVRARIVLVIKMQLHISHKVLFQIEFQVELNLERAKGRKNEATLNKCFSLADRLANRSLNPSLPMVLKKKSKLILTILIMGPNLLLKENQL